VEHHAHTCGERAHAATEMTFRGLLVRLAPAPRAANAPRVATVTRPIAAAVRPT